MTASTGFWLQNRRALESVPDGTIIAWDRIPGDPTSTAIAFVRREIEDGETLIWISPGGWDPHSIDEVGIKYPVEIIRWGDVSLLGDPFDGYPPVLNPMFGRAHLPAWPEMPVPPVPPTSPALTAYEQPEPPQTFPFLHGGSWAREKALECAVLYWASSEAPRSENDVLATAAGFEEWLERDSESSTVQTEKMDDDPYVGLDAIAADKLRLSMQLDQARAVLREAEQFNSLKVSGAFLSRVYKLSQTLAREAGR